MANLKRIAINSFSSSEKKTIVINIDNIRFVEKIYPKTHYEFGKIFIHMVGMEQPLEFNQGRVNSLRPNGEDDWDRFFFDPEVQSIFTEE